MPHRNRLALWLTLLDFGAGFRSTARPAQLPRSATRMAEQLAAADARAFCGASPHAVIVTVWPAAHAQAAAARAWVEGYGGKIIHDAELAIAKGGAVATCLALYAGEDWLETNCWYGESPLPEGPPAGPHAGAKWKAALTWTQNAPLTVLVVDAS